MDIVFWNFVQKYHLLSLSRTTTWILPFQTLFRITSPQLFAIGQLSLYWALLPSASQTLGHSHERRTDRKEGSVTFHVIVAAKVRNSS